MVRKESNLTLELRGHLLSDVRIQSERGMQAHQGKRLQSSDFRAEEMGSDDRLCAICSDQHVACSLGAVFKGCGDCCVPFMGVVGNGAESLAVLS